MARQQVASERRGRENPRMPEERRVVSVLFADVTGSTALGEVSDPEDVRALLARYYAIAREVIGAHGGTLEKFIGDAVMAVFGVPQAHGDDAERSLAAALALRDAVARDPETSALALRIGVNTGEVVAESESGKGDFLITGDAVNVAARLQQQAEPGAIVVGERTRRAVSGFAFGESQPIAMKGKREPVAASTLVGRAERRAPRTPFLGREHDLAQLELVADRAFTERRPQLVTITAPAGTGKSRLVEEFSSRLTRSDVTVATAQCLPYGAAVTFLPLRGLVRGLLRIGRDADAATPLREAFANARYDGADLDRLVGLVLATLGDTSDSSRVDREEVFAAWRLLIEALATRGALLVVFEDLHWASDTLLDLVEHVTMARTAAPLVMVALARPELLDRRPHWGGGRRNFTSLALEPLTSGETRRLIEVLTEGVPDAIAERIVERAGGNPFFLGELVRAYEQRKRAGDLDDDIVLPDTVHATVLARIDALPKSERSVLEYAAVAGRTARVAAVAALLPELGEAVVIDALEALAERDLVVPQGAGAFTFRHIVIREVAYATLARAERVRAHVRLARWFDERGAGAQDQSELVAYHYRQAMTLTPGGRVPDGVDVAAVLSALERAARTAAGVGGFAEARELIQEAIRIAPRSEHLRLNELLGDLLSFGDVAVQAYVASLDRWSELADGDPRVAARLAVKQLGVVSRWAGSLTHPLDDDEITRVQAQTHAFLERAPDDVLNARFACARAFQLARHGPPDPAETTEVLRDLEAARRLFASRGDADAESETLDALSSVKRSVVGDYEGALAGARERIAMADRLRLLERVDAWSVGAWDLVYLGRYDEAIGMFDDALAHKRAGEPEYMFAHAAAWATYAAMVCGRWDDALALCDRLLEMREEAGLIVGRFTTCGWLAGLRVASARMDATRSARYRSTFAAIADIANATGSLPWLYKGFLERDRAAAREYLMSDSRFNPDRPAELISFVLFELGDRVTEEEVRSLEKRAQPALRPRIALARAVTGGPDALRSVLPELDRVRHAADAARAATLLALATHLVADRADAERRLRALGDRAFLQKLAEEW
jgi:class 3 adenylate cyclase/tetratricopeptide (TPR) repeat protein